MSTSDKNIVFLNRAHNDVDMHMSLIEEFAGDGFNVRVIGYPCDGEPGQPQKHEGTAYMNDRYGVTFESVLDRPPAPLALRLLYKQVKFWDRMKKACPNIVFKALHVFCLKILRAQLRKDTPWLMTMAQSWNADILIADEAVLQGGRAYMIDTVIPALTKNGTKLFVIQTGQHIYKNFFTDSKIEDVRYNQQNAERFFVAGTLDQEICQKLYPQEKIEVHGNIRMDKKGIDVFHNRILAPPYFDREKHLERLPGGSPRIVFMLSKMIYGVESEAIIETIRAVSHMQDVGCVIKPHTRSMKFDFMRPEEISGAVIADDIPSSLLIEWADMVLFTGSGIAFHALTVGKRAGFLKYCQNLETLFDGGEVCDIFQSLDDLKSFIQSWQTSQSPPTDANMLKKHQDWLVQNVHAGDPEGRTAQRYKDNILKSL